MCNVHSSECVEGTIWAQWLSHLPYATSSSSLPSLFYRRKKKNKREKRADDENVDVATRMVDMCAGAGGSCVLNADMGRQIVLRNRTEKKNNAEIARDFGGQAIDFY